VIAYYAAPIILVRAAAHQFIKPISEVTTAEWRLTQAVNQEAAFHLTQMMLPAMRAASWGRIILIGSSTYWVGGVSMTHYVTSKGALLGFAHGLAAEVGPYGVTVNCVAPGLTRTAKARESLSIEFFLHIASVQSIKRNGTPEDQAGVVSFLASDDASFIAGQTLLVDGGQGRT
jgi:NAD(P)-dependent dehydrogenase (short-subunit alcohol dehydrogenase family)